MRQGRFRTRRKFTRITKLLDLSYSPVNTDHIDNQNTLRMSEITGYLTDAPSIADRMREDIIKWERERES